MEETNYYKILGISENADKSEIKKAYREKAKKYHPDLNDSPGSDEIFMIIQEAYENLFDDESRQKHDQQLKHQNELKRQKENTQQSQKNEEGARSQQRQRSQYTNSQNNQQRSTYSNQNTNSFPTKGNKSVISVIRTILGILILLIYPASQYLFKGDISGLLIYYLTIFLLFSFSKYIVGLLIIFCVLYFVISLFSLDGSGMFQSIMYFIVIGTASWVLVPHVFEDQ